MTGKHKARVLAYQARLQDRLARQPEDAEYETLRHFAPFAGSVPGAWLDPHAVAGWSVKVDAGIVAGRVMSQPGPVYFAEREQS